jgi:hypothetical protein
MFDPDGEAGEAMIQARADGVLVLAVESALILGLTSCSGSEPAQSTPSADALQPTSPPVAVGLPAAKPAKLVKAEDATGLTSLPWVLTSISDDRGSISVVYVGGDGYCTKPVGFRVQEVDASIEVAALSRQNGDSACGNALVVRLATIDLPKPLTTGVALLHAPVAKSWNNPNFFG